MYSDPKHATGGENNVSKHTTTRPAVEEGNYNSQIEERWGGSTLRNPAPDAAGGAAVNSAPNVGRRNFFVVV